MASSRTAAKKLNDFFVNSLSESDQDALEELLHDYFDVDNCEDKHGKC